MELIRRSVQDSRRHEPVSKKKIWIPPEMRNLAKPKLRWKSTGKKGNSVAASLDAEKNKIYRSIIGIMYLLMELSPS
jgi:hypothetical protein